ncbi:hypothetical protein KP509_12G094600 [Ceratopteris richardii]|uniref:Uncharacterized protein n=1 Tax=Ceratopteris richardii TaxID=49495 RepID=A0A8T2TRZ8_CERRI|nr:hypothetical protein KP509_12G094600 [Ceratopteris richardii]
MRPLHTWGEFDVDLGSLKGVTEKLFGQYQQQKGVFLCVVFFVICSVLLVAARGNQLGCYISLWCNSILTLPFHLNVLCDQQREGRFQESFWLCHYKDRGQSYCSCALL